MGSDSHSYAAYWLDHASAVASTSRATGSDPTWPWMRTNETARVASSSTLACMAQRGSCRIIAPIGAGDDGHRAGLYNGSHRPPAAALARLGPVPASISGCADVPRDQRRMRRASRYARRERSGSAYRYPGARPRALVITHLYGQLGPVEEQVAAARAAGVPVLEDCAQCNGGTYKGRSVGTIGRMAIFSLHLYVFTFVSLLIYFTFSKLQDLYHWGWLRYALAACILYMIVYSYLAMKNFYRQGFFKTLGKYFLMNLMSLTVMFLLFIAFYIFSVFNN